MELRLFCFYSTICFFLFLNFFFIFFSRFFFVFLSLSFKLHHIDFCQKKQTRTCLVFGVFIKQLFSEIIWPLGLFRLFAENIYDFLLAFCLMSGVQICNLQRTVRHCCIKIITRQQEGDSVLQKRQKINNCSKVKRVKYLKIKNFLLVKSLRDRGMAYQELLPFGRLQVFFA